MVTWIFIASAIAGFWIEFEREAEDAFEDLAALDD
jgi:hypothetical protein